MDCDEDDSDEQESDDINKTDTPDSHSLLDNTDESKPANLSAENEDIAAALYRYTWFLELFWNKIFNLKKSI